MLTDHDGWSEDYLENTELNRSIFLSLSSADQPFYDKMTIIIATSN